jgi:hypothetical protein
LAPDTVADPVSVQKTSFSLQGCGAKDSAVIARTLKEELLMVQVFATTPHVGAVLIFLLP